MIKELIKAGLEYKTNSELGEGPMWHPVENVLYWVDITRGILHKYDPETGANKSFNMGSMIGTIVPHHKHGVIAALETGIYHFNFAPSLGRACPDPSGGLGFRLMDFREPDKPQNRFNDGKCDPVGRFWVGTMNKDAKAKEGSLYCIAGNHISKKTDGLTISNGICWSKDSRIMFFVDSSEHCIFSYDFELDTGKISSKKVVLSIDEKMGMPDGMTIDEEDNLWIALWGGNTVIKCNPFKGKITDKISVDAPNVSSCTFGGKNLTKLFITTARKGLSEKQLSEYPLSGSLFFYDTNSKGINANSFIHHF